MERVGPAVVNAALGPPLAGILNSPMAGGGPGSVASSQHLVCAQSTLYSQFALISNACEFRHKGIGEVVVVRPNSGFGAPRPSSVVNGFTVSSATVALAWEVAAGEADGAFQAWPSISRGDAGKAWRVDMRSLLERQRFDEARGRVS